MVRDRIKVKKVRQGGQAPCLKKSSAPTATNAGRHENFGEEKIFPKIFFIIKKTHSTVITNNREGHLTR